jgi:hypothetical protein
LVFWYVADNLSKAGWSWGYVSAVDSEGRTIWIADEHRGDGKRFVMHAEEKRTAFLELEAATQVEQPTALKNATSARLARRAQRR